MSEFNLIQRYFKSSALARSDVLLGIGDDCAVLQPPPGKHLVMTTDTLVSGVHFPHTTRADDIGYKALAVNLSDLAAMGAEPAWVMLALTLPNENEIHNEDWVRDFMRGFSELANPFSLSLIGGDTTSGPLSVTLQLTGLISPGVCLRRDAARIGDKIYVSGTLGDAALGLRQLLSNSAQSEAYCIQRLNRPTPRVDLGRALLTVARCGVDISDGLLADLGHICHASACAARIYLNQLPLSSEFKNNCADEMDWSLVVSGGDDYELCVTVAPQHEKRLQMIAAQSQVALTCIGEIVSGCGIVCVDGAGQEVIFKRRGFEHFVK